MGDIAVFGRGIDHKAQPAREADRHQIVDDAAMVVEQQRVAHPGFAEAGNIAGHQGLQHVSRDTMQRYLSHVRNIEKSRLGAGMEMLGDDARWVLHRHLVAGKRHHLGAARDMQRVERRAPQLCRLVRIHGRTSVATDSPRPSRDAPSVAYPERFTGARKIRLGPAYSFGERRTHQPGRCFPERPYTRSPFA